MIFAIDRSQGEIPRQKFDNRSTQGNSQRKETASKEPLPLQWERNNYEIVGSSKKNIEPYLTSTGRIRKQG